MELTLRNEEEVPLFSKFTNVLVDNYGSNEKYMDDNLTQSKNILWSKMKSSTTNTNNNKKTKLRRNIFVKKTKSRRTRTFLARILNIYA